MLEHLVSGKKLEVDKAKIEVIQNLPLPATLRDLWYFLGHIGFYQRFIRDFVEVSKPLTTLLSKDKEFFIDKEGERAFEMLKLAFIEAPILKSPNWDLPFEIMCDASDYAVGAVLGQRIEKKPTAIWYTSKTPCQSSDELHDYGEGAFGSGLRFRKILALHLGKQDRHRHRSCGIKVLVFQEGVEATIDTMGAASSRI